MKAEPIPCGPAVTESERQALERVKAGLISLPGNDCWYVLTNLMFSVTHQRQPDEIDMVAIGPPGVRVVEVKHWTDAHAHLAENEAKRVAGKAGKIGTTLRKLAPNLPHVDGVVLLTRPGSKAKQLTSGGPIRGIHFHPLKEWRAALRPDERAALSPQEVERLAKKLAETRSVAVDGVLPSRKLAGYVNLELQTAEDERFHRVYKGTHSSRKDRVFLHLYDLSADVAGSAEEAARREHDALHFRLWRFGWAPRVLDSFQDVPGYTGEMKFFTVVDPAVPSIEERSRDDSWSAAERIDFARQAVHAVQQLHEATADELGLVHRNLSPRTILVKHDNSPVLTGFEHVGTPVAHSASLAGTSGGEHDDVVAPEVREHGLSAADQASDVYSLCASLRALFGGWEEDDDAMLVQKANQALEGGLGAPRSRPSLENLASVLEQLLETGSRQAAKKQVLMITACPVQLQDVEICFGGIQRWTQIVAKQGLAGIRLHFVDTAIRNISRIQGESLWMREFSRACNILISLVRHVIRQRFNLVHINCPPTARGIAAAWVYARFLRLRRIPVAVHYHGDISPFAVKPTIRSGLWPLPRLARIADANIVLNRGSGEFIEKITGSRSRTFVLPNFLEDSIFQHRSDNKESALPGRIRILFAGQVNKCKGCTELLEAARQLAEADFVLLGVVNKDMAERVRNLPTNVKIVDQVPQDVVLQEMMASDIFVLPSYWEGFPMAVLEAMAVGLPVVTTRAGALPEMVEDGKGGIIVQQRNVPALVSALRMLMNDPARRKRMAAFNRDKVRAQYTYSMVAPQLMAIYEQIGGASRNPARRPVSIK